MEVTTSPMRWQNFFPENEKRVKDRNERASRTKVTRLDYLASGQVIPDEFTTSEALRAALDEQAEKKDAGERQFRLFVVEDLSRDVIEFLGEHYDIEPAFFRDQIFDNAWYNTRDRWVDPPRLNVVAKQQRWLQIRFATARYFKTEMAFTQGFADFESFNVVRRPEDDCNNKAVWDEPGAIVGLSRTRASFWRNADNHKEGAVGKFDFMPPVGFLQLGVCC
jgi:hypothetical protein